MPLTLKSAYLAETKQIDRQVKRETSGKGRIDPHWAQAKRRIPAIDSILRNAKPQFTGGYGPKATKHPDKRVYLKSKPFTGLSEGDVPFDARLESESHKINRQIKADKILCPALAKNPLAGLPSTMDAPKGNPPSSMKLAKPLIFSRPIVEGRRFNNLRPPLARTSLGGFQQMVEGWVSPR